MDCKIDIRGIGSGEYNYKFSLGTSFFESFGGDIIVGADLDVDFIVTKSGDWTKVGISISGQVEVECDRCLSGLDMPVEIEKTFTVKFISAQKEDEGEYGEDIIVIGEMEAELDMGQTVYDYVVLSLPIQKMHNDGECDLDMIEKMKELQNEIQNENKNIE